MKQQFIVFLLLLSIIACNTSDKTIPTEQDTSIDTTTTPKIITQDSIMQDTVLETEAVIDSSYEEPPEDKIVLDEQLSFCKCVQKQKELEEKSMIEEDDEKMMDILTELNELRNGECANVFNAPQNTQEQIDDHKAKVARCLGEK